MDCVQSHLDSLLTKLAIHVCLQLEKLTMCLQRTTQILQQLPSKQVNHFTKVQYYNTQTELKILL